MSMAVFVRIPSKTWPLCVTSEITLNTVFTVVILTEILVDEGNYTALGVISKIIFCK